MPIYAFSHDFSLQQVKALKAYLLFRQKGISMELARHTPFGDICDEDLETIAALQLDMSMISGELEGADVQIAITESEIKLVVVKEEEFIYEEHKSIRSIEDFFKSREERATKTHFEKKLATALSIQMSQLEDEIFFRGIATQIKLARMKFLAILKKLGKSDRKPLPSVFSHKDRTKLVRLVAKAASFIPPRELELSDHYLKSTPMGFNRVSPELWTSLLEYYVDDGGHISSEHSRQMFSEIEEYIRHHEHGAVHFSEILRSIFFLKDTRDTLYNLNTRSDLAISEEDYNSGRLGASGRRVLIAYLEDLLESDLRNPQERTIEDIAMLSMFVKKLHQKYELKQSWIHDQKELFTSQSEKLEEYKLELARKKKLLLTGGIDRKTVEALEYKIQKKRENLGKISAIIQKEEHIISLQRKIDDLFYDKLSSKIEKKSNLRTNKALKSPSNFNYIEEEALHKRFQQYIERSDEFVEKLEFGKLGKALTILPVFDDATLEEDTMTLPLGRSIDLYDGKISESMSIDESMGVSISTVELDSPYMYSDSSEMMPLKAPTIYFQFSDPTPLNNNPKTPF